MEAPLDNSPLDKPTDVFDRDAEWADLTAFALSPLPGPLPGRGQRSGIRVILSDTGPLAAEFCAAIADDELRVIEITPHDYRRMAELLTTYSSLRLQVVDACRRRRSR